MGAIDLSAHLSLYVTRIHVQMQSCTYICMHNVFRQIMNTYAFICIREIVNVNAHMFINSLEIVNVDALMF